MSEERLVGGPGQLVDLPPEVEILHSGLREALDAARASGGHEFEHAAASGPFERAICSSSFEVFGLPGKKSP